MADQIVILPNAAVLEVHTSQLRVTSGAVSLPATDRIQGIQHSIGGPLAVNCDNGHAATISAFADITDIIIQGSSLINNATPVVVSVIAFAQMTLRLSNLTPVAGDTLLDRDMGIGDNHLLVFWSNDWSLDAFVIRSLKVVD